MIIAGHNARFDAHGELLPWTSWQSALELEMQFYRRCPVEHGYPLFISESFLDESWVPYPDRTDTIPAMQNGMGIISYLKFRELRGKLDPWFLDIARLMGDYLIDVAQAPDSGAYPRFSRSTGRRAQYPHAPDCGCQGDRPFEIEPDKGGIAGYALLLLFNATGERRYLDQALHNARVLAANQREGDASQSPWPFRADYRSGEARGPISGNMTYILRLFDALEALGEREFARSREALWKWIKHYQIPSARTDGALFAQFFEDHETPTNRSAWAPLNLARYLLEQGKSLSGDWREESTALIDFVRGEFTHRESGVRVCHEQDEDPGAWGGVNATYGAVLALFAQLTGSEPLAREARQALNFTLYSIDAQGRPRDLNSHGGPGGWQEDAHTDVIHNYVDALRIFPTWGEEP
jgi:hypothetical protein